MMTRWLALVGMAFLVSGQAQTPPTDQSPPVDRSVLPMKPVVIGPDKRATGCPTGQVMVGRTLQGTVCKTVEVPKGD